jgi:hypothetical protein
MDSIDRRRSAAPIGSQTYPSCAASANAATASAQRAVTTRAAVSRRLLVSAAMTIGTSSTIATMGCCGVTTSTTNTAPSTPKAAMPTVREPNAERGSKRDVDTELDPALGGDREVVR